MSRRRKPRNRYARAPRWIGDRTPAKTGAEYAEGRISRFLRDLAKPDATQRTRKHGGRRR